MINVVNELSEETITINSSKKDPIITKKDNARSSMDVVRAYSRAKTGSETGYDKLPAEELVALVMKAKHCPKAMEQVFLAVFPYMNSIAHKVHLGKGSTVTPQDLFQTSYFGLKRAVEKYDPSFLNPQGRPMSFTTYATHWLKQTVSREVANNNEIIRLPVHAHTVLRNLRHRYATWCCENNEVDNGIERLDVKFLYSLVEDTKATPGNIETILEWLAQGKVFQSLDETHEDAEGSDRGSVIDSISSGTTIEKEHDTFLESEEVRTKMCMLPQRKRLVIFLRFGVGCFDEHTLQEAGDILGLTRERVRQIESLALRMLKSWFTRTDDFIGKTSKGNPISGSSQKDIICADILKKLSEEQIRFLLNDEEIKSLAATVDGFDYLLEAKSEETKNEE